jgi:hypothetical protein
MLNYVDNINTPTEQDLDSCYGSKYLSAADLGDRKIKARLAEIRKVQLRQDNGVSRVKFVLLFEGIDKGLVLNQTNKTVLVDALGRNPASWIGATIGLVAESVQFGGKMVRGLRVRVLDKPAALSAPRPAPEPVPFGDESANFDNNADF